MSQITLDPELVNNIEYAIWRTEDKAWLCTASELPFLGEVIGVGADPEEALKICRQKIQAAFDEINQP